MIRRSFRITEEALRALSAEALIEGKMFSVGSVIGPDADGYVAIKMGQETIDQLLALDPGLDIDNPIELSEMLKELVYSE